MVGKTCAGAARQEEQGNDGQAKGDKMKTRASVINRFLSSFGCDLWRIQIVPRQSAAGVPPRNIIAQSLSLSSEQVLARLPWLSFVNCNGGEIYCRPVDPSGKMRWILVDDVTDTKTKELKAMGSSAIVCTSPGNLQAWFTLATPVEAGCAVDLARQMSCALAGDMHSADNPLQAGRMPAFTNHKPSHCVGSGGRAGSRYRECVRAEACGGRLVQRQADGGNG